MPRVVEEFIYPAMEDFRVDIVLGEGMNARTISMKLKRFTLIGATRSGMLSSPMRDRFKMHEHLEFYSIEELAQIVRINARKLQTEISRRRGAGNRATQPWHAAHRQRPPVVDAAVRRQRSRRPRSPWTSPARPWRWPRWTVKVWTSRIADIWKRSSAFFERGPTGVEAMGATMNLPRDTLSDEIEPYLLREQFIVRTPRGRVATPRAFALLGYPLQPPEGQRGLFDQRGFHSFVSQVLSKNQFCTFAVSHGTPAPASVSRWRLPRRRDRLRRPVFVSSRASVHETLPVPARLRPVPVASARMWVEWAEPAAFGRRSLPHRSHRRSSGQRRGPGRGGDALFKLGADVERDDKAPGRPVTAVNCFGVNAKTDDAVLKNLAGLKNLQTLNLSYARVTDAGMKELAGLRSFGASIWRTLPSRTPA